MMFTNGLVITDDGWQLNECDVFVDLDHNRFFLDIPAQKIEVDDDVFVDEPGGLFELVPVEDSTPGRGVIPVSWLANPVERRRLSGKPLNYIKTVSKRRQITADFQPAW